MKIYIDGKYHSRDDARISVFDHGLLYGDGVFEGIRYYGGGVFRLEEHIDRLYDSARAIHLTVSLTKEEMIEAVLETIRLNDLEDGYVRLLVTRGVGSLGLNPYHCEGSSVIIIASIIQLYDAEKYTRGLRLVTCGTRRLTPGGLSPSIKSLNYLNNILAKMEAINAGCDEGVMLNEEGFIGECTGDNIFVVKGGVIATPRVTDGALRGITRSVILEIAREIDVPLEETRLSRYEVFTADECFLTGTAAEVIAAVELDGRPIGDGQPGPVTRRFVEKFKEATMSCATPVYR